MKTTTARIYRHKREIDKYINIVEDFNTLLSILDRSKVQKSVKIQEVNKFHLTNIYRTLNQKFNSHFSSTTHGIFKEIDHALGDRASLNKIQGNSLKQIIFFDHNALAF